MDAPTEDIDEGLMARLALNDEHALEVLLSRHGRLVFSVAYRHLGRVEDAEDVVQDTFLRLLNAAPRYRAEAPFRSYLLTIVTRLCFNRSSKARTRAEDSADVEAVAIRRMPAPELSPENKLLQDERASAVRRAILALPEDQRMALILFRFEELSYEAIAVVLNRRVSAVTSLLWRARQRLRVELQGFAGHDISTNRGSAHEL